MTKSSSQTLTDGLGKCRPLLASARTTRSRRQTPSKAGSSTAAAFNSRKKGKSPAGPLSIFIPPSNGQIPETSHNAMSSKATSPALDSDLALAADADSIRREAAAGYESRLRARQPGNAKKDGGQRMGVSASGRDVRIGGSTRQAAQQSKKDKGKGKSDVQVLIFSSESCFFALTSRYDAHILMSGFSQIKTFARLVGALDDFYAAMDVLGRFISCV